ncbi:hypothetical protein ACTXG6_33465 [Pseudonocardia sp. Cha107L01]|uniref:hypothetical protein n=1 Tax=Pseudonocardia sp. Cha107L01 TaxID=3457576 RepID=UPI00403ED3A5
MPLYTAGAAPHIGLNDVSGHREDYSFFEQTSIAHYPAVHTRDRAAGSEARCSTRVGVADDSQVIVTADDNGLAVRSSLDTCSEAESWRPRSSGKCCPTPADYREDCASAADVVVLPGRGEWRGVSA